MDEQEFIEMRNKFEIVTSDIYAQIKKNQLEMIIDLAKNNYEPLEIRGMLKLIGKTDSWKEDFVKLNKKRWWK